MNGRVGDREQERTMGSKNPSLLTYTEGLQVPGAVLNDMCEFPHSICTMLYGRYHCPCFSRRQLKHKVKEQAVWSDRAKTGIQVVWLPSLRSHALYHPPAHLWVCSMKAAPAMGTHSSILKLLRILEVLSRQSKRWYTYKNWLNSALSRLKVYSLELVILNESCMVCVTLTVLTFLLMGFYIYDLCVQFSSPTRVKQRLIEKRGKTGKEECSQDGRAQSGSRFRFNTKVSKKR